MASRFGYELSGHQFLTWRLKHKGIVFLLAIVLSPITLLAQTYTSIASGAWTSASTWSGGNIPPSGAEWNTPNRDIVINHSVTVAGSTMGNGYVRNITISSGGSLAVSGNLTVSENSSPYAQTLFTVNGTLTATNLTVEQSASFVVGATGSVTITNTLTSNWNQTYVENAGTLTVQHFVNNGTFVNSGTLNVTGDFTNHYDFSASFGGTTTIGGDLTSNGNMTVPSGSELSVGENFYLHDGKTANIEGTLQVVGNVTNNGNVNVNGGTFAVDGTYSGNSPTGDTGDCSGGGGGCCGSGCAALPVELIFFEAALDGQLVDLSWATATELNNDYFTIEKSTDGVHYSPMLTISGHGTTDESKNYSIRDDLFAESAYYRLSQTDFDGTYELLGYVFVTTDIVADIKIYPNPVARGGEVFFQGQVPTQAYLFDHAGRLLIDVNKNRERSFSIPSNLCPGVYFLQLITESGAVSRKLVVN